MNGYFEQSRHDSEIIITFIRLTFLLFEASAVAKAAYGRFASDRLGREFDVYNALRPLQGVSIPILYGLHWNHNDGSSFSSRVTEVPQSHCKTLMLLAPTIDLCSLCLHNARFLFMTGMLSCRTSSVSIHGAGVQHNDMLTVPLSIIVARTCLAANSLGLLIAWDLISVSL